MLINPALDGSGAWESTSADPFVDPLLDIHALEPDTCKAEKGP
jgi:hypothetical protein